MLDYRLKNNSIKLPKRLQEANSFENYEHEWWNSSDSHISTQFCMESSLHGLRYIGQPRRHIVERIFWFISFIIAVGVAIFCIIEVWDRYKTTPVITVFQPTETTIDLIPFPAISICNTNNVIKSKADEFVRRFEKNPKNTTAIIDLYLLDHICRTSTTFSEIFNFSLNYGSITTDIHNEITDQHNIAIVTNETHHEHASGRKINVVLKDVAQSCNSMILRCLWHDEVMDCNDLFDEVETDYGYCCVFNMVPLSLLLTLRNGTDRESNVNDWKNLELNTDNLILNDGEPKPKFPYRQHRPGKSSGLSVLLDPDLPGYFCTNTDSVGYMALAHLSLDFPRVTDKGIAIKPNTETFLKIRPEVTVAESGIQEFDLEKRNCYFGDEYQLKFYKYYTSANCEDECIANITFSRCQCVRYFMPRDENTVICGANRFNCTEIVRREILQEGIKGQCKNCRPTCSEIKYFMTTSYMPLRTDTPLWEYPNGTTAYWHDRNVTILHVYFSEDSTYPKLRKKLYGFIDLLSNTGGLLGLCLGFSVLSLLEILYFVTLRLYCQTRKGRSMGEGVSNAIKSAWKKFRHDIPTNKQIYPIDYSGQPSNIFGKTQFYPKENQKKIDKNVSSFETLPYYVQNLNSKLNW